MKNLFRERDFWYCVCESGFIILMERATRLELATNSLEGCDSSQLSYTRVD